MADKDSTQTDADSRTQIAEMAVFVEKFIQRINASPGISRETIEAMSEAVKKISQARILIAGEATKIYHEEARESSQASMLRADEATKIYPELENTFAKLNDTISEMDRRMLESATKIMELKKGREEFMKLFNEMRYISRERNHSKVREKIDSVNHWLKKRIIDIDEIMKEEDSATGFDHAASLGKEEDVLCSRNGSDDTEGSRKRQRRGHEPYKFSVLLVEYDTSARIQNKTQIIQFIGRNNLGVKFQVAENGQQAVDLHSRDKASFNLILMDMDMPVHVTTGPEATRSLRALGVKSSIVGFSSESESEKIDQFISSGLSGCLKKPLTVEKIASFLPRPSSQQAITDSPREDKGLIDP
ncbi:two-component response regulator [Salix suchowensis]|nr:two-component response regulator [Salix suchowensis]